MKLEFPENDLLRLPPLSRRRAIRLEPTAQLQVSVPAAKGSPAVKDISSTGLCILVEAPLRLRSVHSVTLTLGALRVQRRARVIHCHAHMAGGWFMGMEFLEEPTDSEWTIDDLLARMMDEAIAFS